MELEEGAQGQLADWASQGGRARAAVLTEEERRDIGRRAVETRWRRVKGADYKAPARKSEPKEKASLEVAEEHEGVAVVEPKEALPYSMFSGKLAIAGMQVECHVLNDGRRVFSQREMVRVISGGRQSGGLGAYLSSLDQEINDLVVGSRIRFKIPQNPVISYGYEATVLIELCDAYLRAREARQLRANQKDLAKQAEIITRACAKVGIIALIDEATGYQQVRAKRALQLKLQAFIADELQEWARMFPEEFWLELARLEGIHYSPRSRPLRWGKYVMAFVYDAVDGDIGRKLREINPNPHHRMNHHQWLKEFGREKVNNQLQRVIGTMQACETMDEFKRKFSRVFKKMALQMNFDDLDWGLTPSGSA